MSAKMVIPQTEADTGFGLLKDIVAMVKNPDAIDEAYQRRLDAVKLNEDEIKKAEAARSIIAQADAVKEQQAQEWARLEAAKIEHDSTVKLFGQQSAVDSQRFNEWENRLTEKQKKQDAADIRHAQERKDLDKRTKEIEDSHIAWEQSHADDKKSVADAKEANRLEAETIAAEKAKIKAKAARIAAEAQKDD